MKASEMIAKVDEIQDNEIKPSKKMEWLHDVEKAVYSQIVTEPYEESINLVKDQKIYTLTGYTVEDILQLKVNGTEYALGSALIQADKTYFKLNGQLCLKPIPTADAAGGLYIIRRWKPAEINDTNYSQYDLLLPDAFQEAYEYYLRSKICFEQKDSAEFNAWGALYTKAIEEFTAWYVPKQPQVASYKKNVAWGR